MGMKTVQLSVKDRLVLLGTLPSQGSFLELMLLKGIKDDLIVSDKERVDLCLTQRPDGAVAWSPESADKIGNKEIVFSEAAFALVAKVLKDLDSSKKLAADHVQLYMLFCLTRDEQEKVS